MPKRTKHQQSPKRLTIGSHLWHSATVVSTTTKSDFQISGNSLGLEARPARVRTVLFELSSNSVGSTCSIAVWSASVGEHVTRSPPHLVPKNVVFKSRLNVPRSTDFGYLHNQDVLNVVTSNALKQASDSIEIWMCFRILVEYKPAPTTDIPSLVYAGSNLLSSSSHYIAPVPRNMALPIIDESSDQCDDSASLLSDALQTQPDRT